MDTVAVEQMPLTPSEPLAIGSVMSVPLAELPNDDDLVGPPPSGEFIGSVRAFGVLEPVLLTAAPGPYGGYRVLSGRRRIKAARRVGLDEIPARVTAWGADGSGETVAALVELTANASRSANPISDIEAIREINQRCRDLGQPMPTVAELSKATGMAIPTLKKRLGLLQARDEIVEGVSAGKIAIGVAEKIAKLTDEQQYDLVCVLRDRGTVTSKDAYAVTRARREAALGQIDWGLLDDVSGPLIVATQTRDQQGGTPIPASDAIGLLVEAGMDYVARRVPGATRDGNDCLVTLPDGTTVRARMVVEVVGD